MKYNLNSSVADRVNFDETARNYIEELKAAEGFDPKSKEAYWEQFADNLDVDDVEEAKARFFDAWDRGITLFVLYDEGHEVYGCYATRKEAKEWATRYEFATGPKIEEYSVKDLATRDDLIHEKFAAEEAGLLR